MVLHGIRGELDQVLESGKLGLDDFGAGLPEALQGLLGQVLHLLVEAGKPVVCDNSKPQALQWRCCQSPPVTCRNGIEQREIRDGSGVRADLIEQGRDGHAAPG